MPANQLAHFVALYDGEIRFTDDHVAEILRTVERLGLARNTLVVLFSDHGDEFFEHDGKGHRWTLYDEVLHVPLIMRLPNRAAAGHRVTQQVSLVDVMPTILDLLDLPGPAGMDGRSLAPALRGEALAERPVYGELYFKRLSNVQAMLRTPHAKVIQSFSRMLHPHRPAVEQYDLELDPTEQRNLARSTGHRPLEGDLSMLRGWLDEQWDRWRALAGGQGRITLDAETQERLRVLGYAGS